MPSLQALDQIVGRQIDHLDVVGPVENAVRHGFAHPDAGDLGDDVVQALDMLDVERREDIDAGGDQLLDIEIALGMAAARRVGVRNSSTSTSCGRRARIASRSISARRWPL